MSDRLQPRVSIQLPDYMRRPLDRERCADIFSAVMLTDRPNIVLATAPKRNRKHKPPKPSLNGPAVVQAREASTPPSDPPAMPRIVKARKPGSKPYLSLNIPKPPPDPDADRKVKAFLKKMMPHHPMLQDDD